MTKYLLLWSVTLVLAGSAASAEPPAAHPPLAGVLQVEPAPAPLCKAQAPDLLLALNPKPQPKLVPICQGDGCTKTSDCRPAGLPECAQCWCLGPAGDKSCGCF
jgi:hypothetical protein